MWELNVCTYNTMLTVPVPIRFNGQTERATRIPSAINSLDIDVIVFVELISKSDTNLLLRKMRSLGWKYCSKELWSSRYVGSSVKLACGGIRIVSKYPILFEHQYVFDGECQGADCFASKGVQLCRINKDGNIFNVVGTHFQAWDSPEAKQIRQEQAHTCFKFIESLNIPPDEPVIFAGDLNIDLYTRGREIEKLANKIGIELFQFKQGSHEFSSDPSLNQLVGNDEDMMYATDKHPRGCYDELMTNMRCPCCPREWLDYIAFSTNHLRPIFAEMHVVKLKSKRPFLMKFNASTERTTSDLSDHFPVVGRLKFDQETNFHNRVLTSTFTNSCSSLLPVVVMLCSGIILVCLVLFYFFRNLKTK